jgi:hypothetical protein
MKTKQLKKAILILLAALFLFVSVTLAKYVVELSTDDQTYTAERFYFRSNLLVENSDLSALSPIAVHGKSTVATVANGAGKLSFSDSDITWTLQYYVDAGEGFVPVLDSPASRTLARGTAMTTETFTITPVIYEGEEYRDVIVEAKASAPYERTLRVRVQFEYEAYEASCTYLPEMGVITATLTTNADAGEYTLTWLYPLIPDNADPNGFLTTAKTPAADDADGNSVTLTLDAHHTYVVHFFVKASEREAVDALTNSALSQWIYTHITLTYNE